MKRESFIGWLIIAVVAYLLYATGGCQHSLELPQVRKGSADAPISLRPAELQKLTGSGSPYKGRFRLKLYNGTESTIVYVDVVLSRTNTEPRRFRLSPANTRFDWEKAEEVPITSAPLAPFSEGTFDVSIGDFLEKAEKGDWSFSIVEALGFRM